MVRQTCLFIAGFIFLQLSVAAQNRDSDSIVIYTQRLINGIATGDTSSWHLYLDDSCLITVESGAIKTKQSFIKDIGIPPSSYKITENIADPVFRFHGNTIVFCYTALLCLQIAEQERITQIIQTDTWMRKGSAWRLISSVAFDKPGLPRAQKPDSSIIKAIVGKYQISDEMGFDVSTDSGKIYIQRFGLAKKKLICESDYVFVLEGNPLLRYIFIHQGNRVLQLDVRRQGSGISYSKISR